MAPDDELISRRDLLRGRLFRGVAGRLADAVTARLDAFNHIESDGVPEVPYPEEDIELLAELDPYRPHRPPGAVDEATFLAECTRCADCLEACPPNAIINAPAAFGPAAGTPIINALRQPCVMCTDPPCIEVCEPRVLRRELSWVMGKAQINVSACLPYHGEDCRECADKCPVEGTITIDEYDRPHIDQDKCTGCGVCLHVCPAPEKAIDLSPLVDRPIAPPL